MAVCMKQLQAAQRFLTGIRELATYANFVEKQAAGVKKSWEKMPAVSPGEAAGILGAIDPQVWSPSHVEGFRLLLASKTIKLWLQIMCVRRSKILPLCLFFD